MFSALPNFHSGSQLYFQTCKSIHINGCKVLCNRKKTPILHILPQKCSTSVLLKVCIFATVIVHICMVTVDLVSNILDFFLSPSPHSLSFSLSPLSRSISVPLLVSVALKSFSSILDPFLQYDIPTSQNDAAEATSFAIALIPCIAFLLDPGGTAMLATLTVNLMVSYILDSLNFKPATFFDGFDDFWGFNGFYSLFD